jgi:hypothetical protein
VTQPAVLIVDLTRRLPDVNRLDRIPPDLDRYGRCAFLSNGAFWFGETRSSHPSSTREGFYWAVDGNRLYVSPRGSTHGWAKHVTIEFVRELARRIGLRPREIQFVLSPGSDS